MDPILDPNAQIHGETPWDEMGALFGLTNWKPARLGTRADGTARPPSNFKTGAANRSVTRPGSIAPRAGREQSRSYPGVQQGSLSRLSAPFEHVQGGPTPARASPPDLSSLHCQRLDKAGSQEAAAVVTKHLGFCDVVIRERFLEVGMAAHVVLEVRSIVHSDRSLHDVEAEQPSGFFSNHLITNSAASLTLPLSAFCTSCQRTTRHPGKISHSAAGMPDLVVAMM